MEIIASRRRLFGGTALVGAVVFTAAATSASAQDRSYNIPAEPLGKALREFGQVSGQQLIYSEDAVRGHIAPALRGTYGNDEALHRLLTGSGLVVTSTATGAVIVRPGGAAPLPQQAAGASPASKASPGTEIAATPGEAQSSQPTTVGDVIVTATRRAERLQDVPIAVTSVSAADLKKTNITDSLELAQLTPGLRMDGTGYFIAPAIRGVTSNQASVSSDANVATYVDGVYQQTTTAAEYSLADVTQIQVLKGPQGTLFGRNATGGAILITTRDPDLEKPAGDIDISYGRFNQVIAKAFLSAPIVDDELAVSVSGYVNRYDGFLHNLATGKTDGGLEDYLLRGKVRFDPAPGVDFVLTGVYINRHDDDVMRGYNINGDNLFSILPGVIIASEPYTYSMDLNSYLQTKTLGASLRGTIEVGPGTLTTTTAYTDVSTYVSNDFDFTNLPVIPSVQVPISKVFTQELVYSTKRFDGIQATVGAFYYDNKAAFLIFDPPDVIRTNEPTKAWALFGEANYDITNQLEVLAGIRYSSERRGASARETVSGAIAASLPQEEATFTAATPRASVIYKFTDNNNVYFTFSKGFKSGIFNALSFQVAPVQPEKITSYEVGSKNEFGDISVNLSGFYYDYRDLQVSNDVANGQSVITVVNNAAAARIYGSEVETAWRPTNDLSLSAGISYLHARYSSFPDASVAVPNGVFASSGLPAAGPAACNFRSIIPSGAGNLTLACDATGKTMIRSPDWSGNVTANYTLHVGPGRVNLSGNVYFTSKIYYDAIDRVDQPAYALFNARIGWRPKADEPFEIAIWGKNLSDRRILLPGDETAIGDTGVADLPRTWGVQLSYAF